MHLTRRFYRGKEKKGATFYSHRPQTFPQLLPTKRMKQSHPRKHASSSTKKGNGRGSGRKKKGVPQPLGTAKKEPSLSSGDLRAPKEKGEGGVALAQNSSPV